MWTNDKIELLKELYPNTDNEIIVTKLGINRGYVIKKANDLGLFKDEKYISELRKKNNPQISWLKGEVVDLKKLFKTHSNNELSVIFGKSKKQIIKKLNRLGLKREKKDTDFIKSKIIKRGSRDLNFNTIKECAKKYNTKHEFYLKDPSAYSKAIKEGWLNKVSKHMICGNFSTPQLMLKDLLEHILGVKCNYNDRTAIKPLEIDCYFPKWKIGWEYDGKYFHQRANNKIDICSNHKIHLFVVGELTDEYRNYDLNIKNQIIKQLPQINSITNKNINEKTVINYKIKIHYPNLLTLDESEMVLGKKMSDIQSIDINLFKRIKKYKLYEKYNIIYDLRKNNGFKTFDEYKKYLIKCEYQSFKDLCKKEHPHRLMKKWGLDIELIKNMYK